MKRYIKASKVSEFLKYYEDADNYSRNPDGFDKMYDILSKYGDENETVDVVFERATPEDQDKMIELIKPELKFGQDGYARKLYHDALEGNVTNGNAEYCQGIVDTIEALMAEGWVDEDAFRTNL